MSKKKKAKVVQLNQQRQSPESYIKNQARQLPIVETFISKDWQENGICNIAVARGHKNGNYTVGIYLVDLFCLGLKDATYEFNLSPSDYRYLKNNSGDNEVCD